jgi:hypothetical protein
VKFDLITVQSYDFVSRAYADVPLGRAASCGDLSEIGRLYSRAKILVIYKPNIYKPNWIFINQTFTSQIMGYLLFKSVLI